MGDTLAEANLLELLAQCRAGGRGGVAGGLMDEDPLQDALYLETREDALVRGFCSEGVTDGKLLILTGSAGDGKTALLGRHLRKAEAAGVDPLPEAHGDATEAWTRQGTIRETLNSFLEPAIERMLDRNGQRSALAINLGIGVRFFKEGPARITERDGFSRVWDALLDATHSREPVERRNLLVLNLSRRPLFEYHPETLGEGFLRDYLRRFVFSREDSPFHEAYKSANLDELHPILAHNIRAFAAGNLVEPLSELLAARTLIHDSRLNPRRLQYLIAQMIYPPAFDEEGEVDKDPAAAIIWNRIYETISEHSPAVGRYLDPTAQVGPEFDERVLNHLQEPDSLEERLAPLQENLEIIESLSPIERVRLVLRWESLQPDKGTTAMERAPELEKFLGAYTFILDQSRGNLHPYFLEVSEHVTSAMESWGADPHEGQLEFHDGRTTSRHRFLAKWDRPEVDPEKSRKRTIEDPRSGHLSLSFRAPGSSAPPVTVPLTFQTYELLRQMAHGYAPSSLDLERSEGIRLIQEQLSNLTKKYDRVTIEDVIEGRRVMVERQKFRDEHFVIREVRR